MLSNKAIENTLKSVYNHYAFTHNYIIGTYDTKANKVYANILMEYPFEYLSTINSSSRNLGSRLRYRQTKELKQLIENIAIQTFELCSLEYLETVARQLSDKQVNRGLAFEKIVTEHYNQIWHHDNIPWYNGPDIVIDSIPYQIKYDSCNFTNLTQMFHLLSGL